MRVTLKHVQAVRSRGRLYYYHRVSRTRLPDDPDSPEFVIALAELNKKHAAAGHAPDLRSRRPRFIYFVRAEHGPIKIGVATKPARRLAELQVSASSRLTLLATIPGDLETERALHQRFQSHRLDGEWFAPAPELLAYIEQISTAAI